LVLRGPNPNQRRIHASEESEEGRQEDSQEEVVFVHFYDSLPRHCGSEPLLGRDSVAGGNILGLVRSRLCGKIRAWIKI
jgi:hypothetical protein